ncbi:YeeE/YedE thiosulfate transporter family protein [Vibrio owensii]|uniref:YeeE/YedE thiosulfate transporter family protein n=1 Tax=Vibrio owensii TaxID=696485 RepID=UPI00339B45BB
MFLLAITLSGTLCWMAVGFAYFFDEGRHFTAFQPTLYSALGGFLFGLGAAFNSGCGVSTVSRLARGELVMVSTILGWFIAWVFFSSLLPSSVIGREISLPYLYRYTALIGLSILLVVFVWRLEREDKVLWASMLGIGVMAGLVFVYEPHWTPSGLLKDMSLSIWHQNEMKWPQFERFALMAALIGGMVIAAIAKKSFEFRPSAIKQYMRHLAAGILMGFGAVMAGGGNDSQLLVALPALSPAGLVAVLSIIAGIFVGVRAGK